MISDYAIKRIIGIEKEIPLSTVEMSEKFIVSFFPKKTKISTNINSFEDKITKCFIESGIKIIPYDEIWEKVPTKKRIKRFLKYFLQNILCIISTILRLETSLVYIPLGNILKLASPIKIKKGISIICFGEQDTNDLQMQYISSFKDNSIITIIDIPDEIIKSDTFEKHFDYSMKQFAHHMTNVVIGVNSDLMVIYNFNLSHPIYNLNDKKINDYIINALIPKIVAPISPHKLDDFYIYQERFDPNDDIHNKVIDEMKKGSEFFSKTKLFPMGKKVDELPFRNNLHRHIGKLHLDNRNGMSFGFLAQQMPISPGKLIDRKDFILNEPTAFADSDYYVDSNGNSYILVNLNGNEYVITIPEIWVMTLRSGSDKTNFEPNKDLIKIGVKNGNLLMRISSDTMINSSYKPSFDTKVILSHAVGNYLISSILNHLHGKNIFSEKMKENGLAICHWHGYFNKEYIPDNMIVYGKSNPYVPCSSPQSAFYALNSKIKAFCGFLHDNKNEYHGDIHIEPHHGVNVNTLSLSELAQYILSNPNSTELGNKYYNQND